jgi:hypothetical protein
MGVCWLNLATFRKRTDNQLKSIGKIIMDDTIKQALGRDLTIDITTTGRKTG